MLNLDAIERNNTIKGAMKPTSLILLTKLLAPQLKSTVLPRTRLVERILNARDRKLILVCADAGYGKTTLLAQACARFGTNYFYYDLEPGDNDSARFLQYLVRGFQTRFPDLGHDLPDLIAATREPEALVGALINDFNARVKVDFYILLDDYHHLQKNLEIAKILEYLLRHMPANLHLIIASRSRPPLNLPYYEAKGELLRLEKEHLHFTEAEVRELFNSVHKLRIGEADLKKIVEQSAGWITAVQLILQKIIARQNEPPDETIRSSLAAGAPVFDYFAIEILEDHPPQIQDFLVRSSVLETIEPDACDHLFQARNSAKLLDYITQENVFITKAGRGFRYHPLFRDFLIRRLTETYPAQAVTGLYRRLADYHLDRKDYQSAVDAFLTAADFQRAAEVLTEHYPFWRDTGAYESYLGLVDRIPAAVQDRYPAFLVHKMHSLHGVGNLAGIMNNHKTMLRRLRREKDRKPLIDYLLFMSLIMYLLRENRKSVRLAQEAERLTPARDRLRKASALSRIGFTYIMLMEYDRARDYCERAVKVAEILNDPLTLTMVRFNLAMYHWLSGNLRAGYSGFEQLIRESMDLIPPFNRIRINLNAALLAVENNREAEAETYLAQAETYLKKYPSRPLLMDLEYWKAQIRIWQDRPREALASLEKALDISRSLNLRYPEYLALVGHAQVHLIMGDTVRARAAMDRADAIIPANLPVSYRLEYGLTKMNIEIDERRFDEARRSRDGLKALVSRRTIYYHRIPYYWHLAYLHLETGEEKEALKYIDQALAIGEKSDHAFIFIFDSRPNHRLLEAAVQHGIGIPYLTRILPMVRADWGRDLMKQLQAGTGRCDLECAFFGPFTVRSGRGRLASPKWRTRNSKPLFAELLWAGERGCTRDKLIEEFWPRQNLKRAGHNLQVEISALRAVLSRLLGRPPAEDLILFRHDTYWINPELIIKTDAAEFERRLREARQAGQDPKQRKKLLKEAAELCRAGFCTDIKGSWCEAARDHFADEREKILREIRPPRP